MLITFEKLEIFREMNTEKWVGDPTFREVNPTFWDVIPTFRAVNPTFRATNPRKWVQ